jgi:hypothetical protein
MVEQKSDFSWWLMLIVIGIVNAIVWFFYQFVIALIQSVTFTFGM